MFFEAAFKKRKKNVIQNSNFQTLLTFNTWNLHYSSKTTYVYNIYCISTCAKDNKSD